MRNLTFFKKLILLACVMCLTLCGCSQNVRIDNSKDALDQLYQSVAGNTFNDKITNLSGEKQYYEVTLNENNGSLLKVYQVTPGQAFAKPQDPVYGNNIFLGWFSEGKEYDFSAPVTKDITIIALWEKIYSSALYSVTGNPTTIDGGFRTGSGATIMANPDADFDRGSIEVTVTSPTKSDSGIIFCLENNNNSVFWEQDVSYYFFFVNIEGLAYLGKVDNGKWVVCKTIPIENFTQGQSYTLKVVLDGTDVYCFVDGYLHIAFSEWRFLTGKGFGLRTGTEGVTFTDFSVSGKVN